MWNSLLCISNRRSTSTPVILMQVIIFQTLRNQGSGLTAPVTDVETKAPLLSKLLSTLSGYSMALSGLAWEPDPAGWLRKSSLSEQRGARTPVLSLPGPRAGGLGNP